MKKLNQVFPASTFVFTEVGELIDKSLRYHPLEYEHIEETSAFLGMTWMAVEPTLLAEHHWAFHYFNAKAFAYFLPSVLHCGSKEFDVVNDACRIILTYINIGNDENSHFNIKSILNKEQLNFLIGWITDNIDHYANYGLTREAGTAIAKISN